MVVKEVGFGLAPDVVGRLFDAGVAAVDVAGVGGTSWTRIEGKRAPELWRTDVCEDLAEWGTHDDRD
jgi:isopentenyl-diphosphate Delta-isomerase